MARRPTPPARESGGSPARGARATHRAPAERVPGSDADELFAEAQEGSALASQTDPPPAVASSRPSVAGRRRVGRRAPELTVDEAGTATTAPAETSTSASARVPDAPANATDTPVRRRVGRTTSAQKSGAAAKRPPTAARRPNAGLTSPISIDAPLDPNDASVPLAIAPYVPADLRRVAIMAGLMVMLIIAADIIVSNVVK